jgi:hypothetical protein
MKTMRIEGSIRANLIAAVASARRLRGRPVHSDTIAYWRQLLDYARRAALRPEGEAFGELLAELETELAQQPA